MDNLSHGVCAAVLVAAATVLAAACGGSSGSAPATASARVTDEPSVARTVSATATPSVTAAPTASQHPIEPCPNQSVCDLGHGLAAALKDGDASFILSHWQGKNYTCPGTPARVGGPFPL